MCFVFKAFSFPWRPELNLIEFFESKVEKSRITTPTYGCNYRFSIFQAIYGLKQFKKSVHFGHFSFERWKGQVHYLFFPDPLTVKLLVHPGEMRDRVVLRAVSFHLPLRYGRTDIFEPRNFLR